MPHHFSFSQRLKFSLVVHSAGLPSRLEHWIGSRNIHQIQQKVLRQILTISKDSRFGKEHHLGKIRSIHEYQRQLPIQTYDSLSPYLEQVEQGNLASILPPKDHLIMFGLTSGTSGKPKKIPITNHYLERFRKTYFLWSSCTLRDHPHLAGGYYFGLFSNWQESFTARGVPCGAVTGLLASLQPPWIRRRMTLPLEYCAIHDQEIRDAVALHHAMSHPVSLITAANPSSVLRLAKRLEREGEQMIREIRDGTFRYLQQLPEAYRSHPDFRPHPKRSKFLDRQVQAFGHISPRVIWPDLAVVACWTGGTLTPYLNEVRQRFPGITIRDPGLVASEGRLTIPIADETAAGLPDIPGIFFEFFPVQGESEVPVGKREVLLTLEELEDGKEYYLLFTTPWGLFRYHIDDIVRVEGFYKGTPLLRFVRKGSGYASITGEKLSEDQVVQAMHSLPEAMLLKRGEMILAPRWGDPPGYVLVLEKGDDLSPEEVHQAAARVEEQLCRLNVEYESKRKSGRLAALEPYLVEAGTFERLRRREIQASGGRAEQHKFRRLRGDYEFLKGLD